MSNPKSRIRETLDTLIEDSGRGVPVVSLEEIGQAQEAHGDLRDGDRWGPWAWDADARTLDFTGSHYTDAQPYYVRVDQIFEAEDTSAKAYEWIMHVAGKAGAWGAEAVGYFVLALRTILSKGRPS